MLRKFEFSLTFWRPDGSKGDKQFLMRLAEQYVETKELRGMGEPHSDVWINACETSFERHRDHEEPEEAMMQSISASLTEFAKLLDKIALDVLETIREKGFAVTGIVNAEVDDNEIEFIVPNCLLASLGRLGIDLRINSAGCAG